MVCVRFSLLSPNTEFLLISRLFWPLIDFTFHLCGKNTGRKVIVNLSHASKNFWKRKRKDFIIFFFFFFQQVISGSMYSSINHVKFVEDSLEKIWSYMVCLGLFLNPFTAWELFIFPYSDWIRRNMDYLSAFSPRTGKCVKIHLFCKTRYTKKFEKR